MLPSNGLENATDTLVTLTATQTLSNKTIADGVFTGTLTVEDINASGNVTLGSDSADTVTFNGASSFSASATFNNTVVANQGATFTGVLNVNNHIDMVDDKSIKLGNDDDFQLNYSNTNDISYFTSSATNGLRISSDILGLYKANHTDLYVYADPTNTIIYHNNTARITTSATGITVTGEIDDVGNVNTTGNIVSTGGNSLNHQLGNSSAAKLGVGRAAATYNLEVEGSIFATGSSLIIGDTGTAKAIIQKRTVGLGLHFTDESGVDQAELDGNGNFGIGKAPSYRLDVSGNSWIDGDITINTTNPVAKIGGKIFAREIQLTDPQTGSTVTLDTTGAGGVSRAKVYFHSFN